MLTRKTTRARERRKLGHGQYPLVPAVNASLAPSGSTVVVTFDRPVSVSGPLPLTVATRTYVSQTVDSPTQVTVTFSNTVATKAYSYPANDTAVRSYQGGTVAAIAGTFP